MSTSIQRSGEGCRSASRITRASVWPVHQMAFGPCRECLQQHRPRLPWRDRGRAVSSGMKHAGVSSPGCQGFVRNLADRPKRHDPPKQPARPPSRSVGRHRSVCAGISLDLDPADASSTACWSTLAAKSFSTWQHETRVALTVGAAADFALKVAAVSMLEAALRRRPAKGQGSWWCPSCAASSVRRGPTCVSGRASQRLTRRLRRAEANVICREPRICPSIDHPADGQSRSVAQAWPTGRESHGRRTA